MVEPVLSVRIRGSRLAVSKWVESNGFIRFVTTLIVINAVTLGLETDPDILHEYGPILHLLDRIILIVFTFELALKFYAYRFDFFRSGWNVFDFLIVSIAWVPASGPLSVLRALRILRVLRLISVVPQMRRVISALGHSIPGMASVVAVLCLIFYVSAVLATKLFGVNDDPNMQEWFGTIGASAYTLFQIMTLESWSMGIVRPTMENYPLAWMFFVPFIIITSFAVLNLFIGIIVDAMQMVQNEEREEQISETYKAYDELRQLNQRMETLQIEVNKIKGFVDK